MPLESLTGDFPLCSQHDLHPRVDILLITHNGRHHLERLLPSLRRTKYKNYRLFLLDNASTDGSGDLVRQFYPDFVHLRSEKNLGFAKANNLGIKRSIDDGSEFSLMLNDDTEILDPYWLDKSMLVMTNNPLIASLGFEEVSGDGAFSLPSDPSIRDVQTVVGFCCLMRNSVLRSVGLLDERYSSYREESDLQCRQICAGFRVCLTDIPVFHYRGGSFAANKPFREYLLLRNTIRFYIKNGSILRAWLEPFKYFLYALSPIKISNRPNIIYNRCLMYDPKRIPIKLGFTFLAIIWNVFYLPESLYLRWTIRRESSTQINFWRVKL